MKKNSNYWIKRIANETYKTYNSLEDKNRALIDMFQEATLDIENELYTLGNKINSGRAVTLSDMHKYNRLTNLKKSMEDRLELLTKNVEEFGTTNMVNGGKKVYDNVIGNIADTSFSTPNQRAMEEMLNKPWNGSNFSKRLWKNTQVLANNLNDILTIGLTQGKTLTELAVQLRNRMNKSFNECHRLVRTETMHYLNESAFRAYKDGGCEEVELYAAEDERTCEICGARHGKRYKINKRPILPFHPNCRCTYLPVINMKKVEESTETLEELKKQFSELTDGYSYDDFMSDFESIEEGFEGASESDIEKAKRLSSRIKSLTKKNIKSDTKTNSIITFEELGIKFEDKSSSLISDEVKDKFAQFVNDFEINHARYFVKNKVKLKSISTVDSVKNLRAGGVYRDGSNAIEIKVSSIKKTQSPHLSKSDDFEMHTLAHEYGHYIADTLSKNLGISDCDIVQKAMLKYFDGDIWKASVKNLKEPLSAYGSTKYGEAFAEAFAEAYTCKNPGRFAKIFKEELEKAMKKI